LEDVIRPEARTDEVVTKVKEYVKEMGCVMRAL
jgi:uncharacterized protein YlzI (FlbEa/FlbD family)